MKNKISIYSNAKKYCLVLFVFLFLTSCETISYIPNKIVETGSDTVDYVSSFFKSSEKIETEDNQGLEGEKLSSDEKATNNKEEPQKNAIESDDKPLLETSEEILKPVPTESMVKKDVNQDEGNVDFSVQLDNKSKSIEGNIPKSVNPKQTKAQEFSYKQTNSQELKSKTHLSIKNKIQFRIATINFNSGSSAVNNIGLKKIKKVLKLAKEKEAIVRIVGHASTRTKDMDILKHKLVNFKISDMRAQSVANVFIKNKFPLNKLITEAVSDSKPLFHELMPAGTYANQRTEIYLIY